MSVTDEDRAKAQLLCAAAADSIVFGRWERGSVDEAVDAIATALAAEREKARAPFRALVAFYDRHEYSTLNVDDLRERLAEP